jgi:membrane-bound lytic murein transglycosylase D
MMKVKTLLFLIFITLSNLNASVLNDTIKVIPDDNTARISRDLDSLVNSWYVKLAIKDNPTFNPDDSVIIEFPDSVYMERLNRINSVISLPYHPLIRNSIRVYTDLKREDFRAILGLKDYYFPMIEDIFDSYGLPAELKYMAVIESALNPNAVSRAGATGMWQFMYSTGRLYGLTINSIIDERRDPVKATHAAAKYLKDMYSIYNDWTLVIAAYNCGPGNVDKAIRRSGNKKDYWDIFYRLPRETRGYIPQYLGAFYSIVYSPEHHIQPLPINIPVATDTIMVNKDIHLAQISEVLHIPLGELRALNPQYRTGLIPGSTKSQSLTLPINHLGDFIDLNDTIRNYKSDIYLNKKYLTVNPTRSTNMPPDIKGKTKLYYTVKDGDNLGFIAEWFKVGLSDLRYWNDIYGNTIRVGQKIALFVDPSKAGYYSEINNMTFAEKQSLSVKNVLVGTPVVKANSVSVADSEPDSEYIIYTVQDGDTIWDIVKKFDSVSTSEVLALNSISDPGKIKVGQKLKIKKKS